LGTQHNKTVTPAFAQEPTSSPAAECAPRNEDLVHWERDYSTAAEEMENECREILRMVHTELIGKHGPPLEIDVKNAACFGSCKQFMSDVEYLFALTGCACDELDSYFPLKKLGIDMETWCQRNPGYHIENELGIFVDWADFDLKYCKCAVSIRCESFATHSKPTLSFMSITLILLFIFI